MTKSPRHDYMLTDDVWRAVHSEGPRGFLHDHCLLARAAVLGLEFTAESFTTCLCYVNRNIHLPTVEALLAELAARHRRHVQRDKERGRATIHYAFDVTFWMQFFSEQDQAMQNAEPSPFAGLFRSDPQELGSRHPRRPKPD
jgi:hypothetical protein